VAGLSSALILARNDHTVQEIAESTRERAMKQGLDVGDVQSYGAGDSNFATYIYKGSADAWIVLGETRDTADVLRSLKKLGYAPRLFFARSAADPRFVRAVGQDAEFALAVKEYDPKFRTLGNQQFAAAFEARWSAPPTFAAAQGHAAGTVLAEAVRRTKSLDQEKLRDMLAEMETDTVLGGYKVDPETGEQRAARPAVVQIQRGKPEVIWPEWLQSSTLQPYPQWSERKLVE
jgi:branched-chain amino acid transport system substrate-binding protein